MKSNKTIRGADKTVRTDRTVRTDPDCRAAPRRNPRDEPSAVSTGSQDLVCEQATEPVLLRTTMISQDQIMKRQKNVITQLEEEKSNLTDQVKTLQDTVEDLRNQLCETHMQCDALKKEYVQDREVDMIMVSEAKKMFETLKNSEKLLKVSLIKAEKKHQKDVATITQLEEEKSKLMYEVEALKDTVDDLKIVQAGLCEDSYSVLDISLAIDQRKHQKDVETITQLEEQKSNLTEQVKTLEDTVEDLRNQLCETHLQCDELKNEYDKNREIDMIMVTEAEEMIETLKNSEKLLKVTLNKAEGKHQKDVKTIAQLQEDKSKLMYEVGALKDTLDDLKVVQAGLREDHDKIMNDYIRLREAHNDLQAKYADSEGKLKLWEQLIIEPKLEWEDQRILMSKDEEMIETLENSEKFWEVSLSEAEKKHQKDVGALTDTVENLMEVQAKLQKDHDEIMDAQNDLKAEVIETEEGLRRCEDLLTEYERDREADRILMSEYMELVETLENSEEYPKVSLTEAEKHQKDVETITQLEEEKSNLTEQVKTLQDTVEDLRKQLCETHLQCDKLKNEYDCEHEAHSHLKSEYQKVIKTLTNSESLLEVSLTEAEKHQKDVETITQLEEEKSNLTEQVKTLQDTVEDLRKQLCENHLQFDELKNRCEGEHDAHSHLKSEYQKVIKTLTNSRILLEEYKQDQEARMILMSQYKEMIETQVNVEKFPKVSLTEAEKHQKDVETITQLEEEKSNLTEQVKTLQDTVEDLRKQLCENHLQFDELKNVTLTEAENKHQKDVETIAQLEEEKSKLVYEVGALKDTVKNLVEVQAKLNKDHHEVVDEYTQLQYTHNVFKAQYKETEEKLKRCEELLMTLSSNQKFQKDYERNQEVYRLLMSKYKEMIKTLKNCEKLLKVSLTEVDKKDQKDVKFKLVLQVGTLKDTVENLVAVQSKLYKDHCKIMHDYTQLQEAYNDLQAKYHESKEKLKRCKELLKVYELESHSTIKRKKNKLKTQEGLKESLGQADKRLLVRIGMKLYKK